MQPPLIYVWLFLACLAGSAVVSWITFGILFASETKREREFREPDNDARILPATPKQARQIEHDESEILNP